MALSDKDIVITPNKGQASDPQVVFSGASASLGPQNITLRVYPNDSGSLSFEGSSGQLFSITNSLTGTIFSVNDVSGIPSIEVIDSGLVKIGQYTGNVLVGTGTDNATDKLQVSGSLSATTLKANTLTTRPATNQDAITISGRAGGTSGFAVTLTPTTLTANRTLTLPDATASVIHDGGSYANPTWITSLSETKVLPSQSTNSGKYLTTNGTTTSWTTTYPRVADVIIGKATDANTFTIGSDYYSKADGTIPWYSGGATKTRMYANSIGAGYYWASLAVNNTTTSPIMVMANYYSGNIIYSSPDGITWTQRSLPSSNTWRNVAFALTTGGALFIAQAPNTNAYLTSTNGTTWTTSASTFPISGNWSFIGAANNTFYTIAAASNTLYSSTDGATWSSQTLSATKTFIGIATNTTSHSSTATTVLVMTSSTDANVTTYSGGSWSERTLPNSSGASLSVPVYYNKLFVVFGNASNKYWTSPDGITWTQRTLPSTPADTFRPYVHSGLLFVYNHTAWTDPLALSKLTMFSSVDAISWTGNPNTSYNTFSQYTNWTLDDYDIAATKGNFAVSINYQGGSGQAGYDVIIPTDSTAIFDNTSLGYGISKFLYNGSIAVGVVPGTTTYYTTTDFTTFTQRTLPTAATAGQTTWYLNNLFIVLSNTYILYSSDGINWTTITNNASLPLLYSGANPNPNFVTLAYENSNYIIVTAIKDSSTLSTQRMYVSTDLTNWTQYTVPAPNPNTSNWTNYYQTVRYLNGYYFFLAGLAGGGGGPVVTTTDFSTYNSVSGFNSGGTGTLDVTYSYLDKNYYAIGYASSGVLYKGTGSSALTSSGSWSTVYSGSNGLHPQHIGFDSLSGSAYVIASKGVILIPNLSSVTGETVALTSYTPFADGSTRYNLSYVGTYNGYIYMYDSTSQVFGKVKIAAGSIRKPSLTALSSEVGNYYIREL